MANVRLTIPILGAWVQAKLGPGVMLVAYARQPDNPDRVTTIMRVGAGKDLMEGMFEEVPFRFQTRGRSESLADAERLMFLIDDMIFDINNEMIGPVYVTTSRTINKPKQVPITDKQSRFQFTADYMLVASRFNEEV